MERLLLIFTNVKYDVTFNAIITDLEKMKGPSCLSTQRHKCRVPYLLSQAPFAFSLQVPLS